MAQTQIVMSRDWDGEKGRTYTIHLFIGEMIFKTTLSEDEFFEMVLNYNNDIEVAPMCSEPEDDEETEAAEFARRQRLGSWAVGSDIGRRVVDPSSERL